MCGLDGKIFVALLCTVHKHEYWFTEAHQDEERLASTGKGAEFTAKMVVSSNSLSEYFR